MEDGAVSILEQNPSLVPCLIAIGIVLVALFAVVIFERPIVEALASFFRSFRKSDSVSESADSGNNGVSPEHELVISAAVAAVMPQLGGEGELVAVLAAAAYAAIGEECVVIRYKDISPDMNYARQGRQQLFSSKNYVPRSVPLK